MSLPNVIYVHGMPLVLRGWNGKYHMRNENCYDLVHHNYYGIPIKHAVIIKDQGFWKFVIADWITTTLYRGAPDSPIGEWGDILVTEKNTPGTWVRSNSYLATVVTAVATGVGAALYCFS